MSGAGDPAAVRDWLDGSARRLWRFFLPGYRPELNPNEYPNNDVMTNAVGRQRAATKPELLANVDACPRATQRRPNIVRSYFRAEDVQYAAGYHGSLFSGRSNVRAWLNWHRHPPSTVLKHYKSAA